MELIKQNNEQDYYYNDKTLFNIQHIRLVERPP